MVFARTKLLVEEDVYKPFDVVRWDFPVKDTKRFYESFKDVVLDSFSVDEKQVQEVSFNWDKANNYKVSWLITKEFDDLSYGYTRVKLAAKTSEDGSGMITIEVNPVVRTEYPQDTVWQKTFLYEVGRMIADKLFYESQRMKYVAEMQRITRKFETVVKRFSLT